MRIWPGGKAPSAVAPGFIRPHLTFCEGLRNNISPDFPEGPTPFQEEPLIQRPGCFHYPPTGMHGICYGSPGVTLAPMQEWQKFDFWSPSRHPQYALCFPLFLYRHQGGKWSPSCLNQPGKEDSTLPEPFFPKRGYPVTMVICPRQRHGNRGSPTV